MCCSALNLSPIVITVHQDQLFPLYSAFVPVGRTAFVHLYQVVCFYIALPTS